LISYMSERSALFCPATPTTYSYTLSLHDALPISDRAQDDLGNGIHLFDTSANEVIGNHIEGVRDGIYFSFASGNIISENVITRSDRKSTRLNSSHVKNSYAVFCLKKKNQVHAQDD